MAENVLLVIRREAGRVGGERRLPIGRGQLGGVHPLVLLVEVITEEHFGN